MTLLMDLLLAGGLVWLGTQVVAGNLLFRSLIMFVVFGLLMAVVWARLGATDLALAEAAVGAGVMGAMLLLGYRRLTTLKPGAPAASATPTASPVALPVAALSAALVLGVGVTLTTLPPGQGHAGSASEVASAVIGLGNPVTAVLLVFRGYDTLLEMIVLLVAWLGVTVAQPAQAPSNTPSAPRSSLLNTLVAVVVPGSFLVSGYLMHAGGEAPGGAFQAGAVLAGAGVLLALCGRLRPRRTPSRAQQAALVLGPATFLLLAFGGLLAQTGAMSFPGKWAIYLVEAALTVSIATCLLLLFLGAGGVRRSKR